MNEWNDTVLNPKILNSFLPCLFFHFSQQSNRLNTFRKAVSIITNCFQRQRNEKILSFLVRFLLFSHQPNTLYIQNVMNLSKFYNSVATDISVDGTEFHLERLISEWWSWKSNADEVNERLLTLRLSAERQREQWSVTLTHTKVLSLSLTRLMVLGKERLKCERVWMTERKRERNSSIYRRRSVQHVLAFSDLSIHGSTDKSIIFYFNLWTQFKIIIFLLLFIINKILLKKIFKNNIF